MLKEITRRMLTNTTSPVCFVNSKHSYVPAIDTTAMLIQFTYNCSHVVPIANCLEGNKNKTKSQFRTIQNFKQVYNKFHTFSIPIPPTHTVYT